MRNVWRVSDLLRMNAPSVKVHLVLLCIIRYIKKKKIYRLQHLLVNLRALMEDIKILTVEIIFVLYVREVVKHVLQVH